MATARFYGALYNGAGEARRRAAFLGSLLGDQPSTILDVSAGVGDLAFALARLEHKVVAFEPCAEIYAVLFDRAARDAELRHLVAPLPCSFDAYPEGIEADMVVIVNTWSHASFDSRASLLRASFKALRPSGLLVINAAQATPLRPDQPFAEIHKKVFGDTVVRHFGSSRQLDRANQQEIRFEYRVEHCGRPVFTESSEFLLTTDRRAELEAELLTTGFCDLRCWSGFDAADYDDRGPGFVLVARKAS